MGLESIFDDLFTASWRGVEFAMLDSHDETGRRWVRFLFPGRDNTVHEDLGAFDGPIRVQGLLIGDDYIRQAGKLREAFRAPGPATLVHPWRGEIECVLAEPASISFSDKEMRVARFDAVFEIWIERPLAPPDTLGKLLDLVADLRYQLRAWLRQVLAPVRLAFQVIAAVQSAATGIAVTMNAVVATARGSGALFQQLAGPFVALGSIGGLVSDASYGGTVADRLAAPASAILAASQVAPVPAIGSSLVADAPVISARTAAQLLLDLAAALAPGPASRMPAVALAAQGYAVAAAVEAASAIDFDSRQDAEAWRGKLEAAITAVSTGAAARAAADPAGAGPIWRALADLRSGVAADLQARIGRLPAVLTITLAQPAATWQLAQHLAGDDPGRVVAQYLDLLARNRIRHPAMLPAGVPLERIA